MQLDPNFEPIPVVFAPSQQRGHDVAVYIFPHDHSLCYEFFFHCRSVDKKTQTYLCCGCKALRARDKNRYRQPMASCKLRDGHFITDPMNPFRPHFCMPRSTPQATTRRLIIERCNELRAGPCKKATRNVVEEILSDITSPKFDAFPIRERRVMVEQIASPYGNTRENIRRTLQRNQRRGLNPPPPRPRLTGKTKATKSTVKIEVPSPEYERTISPSTSVLRFPSTVVPRRFVCIEPIRTLIFMDVACTHLPPLYKEAQRRCVPQLLEDSAACTNNLKRLIMETQPEELPRITEMTFMSIPREVFTRGQRTVQSLMQESPDQSFVLRLSANIRTCQLNPELTKEEWLTVHTGKSSDSSVVCRPFDDLELKSTFMQEWPSIREFLDACPKPACLIAHNGMSFDFRALYGELSRCGFLEKGLGIPKGVVFVDSTLAIREIEQDFFNEVSDATKELASRKAVENVAAYEDIVSESGEHTIPASGSGEPTTAVETAATSSTPTLKDVLKESDIDVLNDSNIDVVNDSEPTTVKQSRISAKEKSPEIHVASSTLDEHPLCVFDIQKWPAAKMRRIRPDFFRRTHRGWEFNSSICTNGLKDDLASLYESVVKAPYTAHFTQDDTEALVQVCVTYGREFQDYIDFKSAHFPF
ncbi:hypothetical protein Q1695_002747 [Nippostrongylus brasiliensis]|nr:hypothetical protein Q1695_002747 [Nippostrongylus brasiliensis]